jgi:hypothetical protein
MRRNRGNCYPSNVVGQVFCQGFKLKLKKDPAFETMRYKNP